MLSFQLSNICGSPFKQGNIAISQRANVIYSPIGNRIKVFDLEKYYFISNKVIFEATHQS